jgi:hypothetical protein
MEDTLVTFETAKLAKEKGFTLVCRMQYTDFNGVIKLQNHIDVDDNMFPYASTQSLLQKWLREEHNIHVSAFPVFSNKYFPTVRKFFEDKEYKTILGAPYEPGYSEKTYEEALEKGLQEGLKLIKI